MILRGIIAGEDRPSDIVLEGGKVVEIRRVGSGRGHGQYGLDGHYGREVQEGRGGREKREDREARAGRRGAGGRSGREQCGQTAGVNFGSDNSFIGPTLFDIQVNGAKGRIHQWRTEGLERMKVCGILGGMGPDVTTEMITRILARTPAAKEQDHIPLIVNHNPQIPDRTAALVAGGEDPVPHLVTSIKALERAGADFIAVPCNTAHCFYDQMQAAVPVPLLHMPRQTVRWCLERNPDLQRVGLLATTGTVQTGLYNALFKERGVELTTPDETAQRGVMDTIMAIKAREELPPLRESMLAVARSLIDGGAELILIGCTDISIVVKEGDLDVPVIDALDVLIDCVIRDALCQARCSH